MVVHWLTLKMAVLNGENWARGYAGNAIGDWSSVPSEVTCNYCQRLIKRYRVSQSIPEDM